MLDILLDKKNVRYSKTVSLLSSTNFLSISIRTLWLSKRINLKGLCNPHIAQSLALLNGQRTIQRVVSKKPSMKTTKFYLSYH